jgi:hypothetical protein
MNEHIVEFHLFHPVQLPVPYPLTFVHDPAHHSLLTFTIPRFVIEAYQNNFHHIDESTFVVRSADLPCDTFGFGA